MATRRQADSPGGAIQGGTPTTTVPGQKPKKPKDETGGKYAGLVTGDGTGPLYIGVESGSDLETQGVRADKLKKFGVRGQSFLGSPRGPKYKVGYLNSQQFGKELGGKDRDVIEFYQQRLAAVGLLKKYDPGQLDKATRAAFKEIVTAANQTGKSWQQSLQDTEAAGGMVDVDGGQERDPFQAVLSDPVYLRETFQNSVRQIYGGDLPDAEVDAMVNAFRSQQMAKQQAAYDAEGMGGTVESAEMSPDAFAVAAVKEKHPQQLDRVKFADTFGSIMDTFRGGAQ